MKEDHAVDVTSQDLATLFVSLAGQLRCDALAVTGLAHEQGGIEDAETRTLAELAGSLERAALMLDALRPRLCHSCQTIQIEERWTFRSSRVRG